MKFGERFRRSRGSEGSASEVSGPTPAPANPGPSDDEIRPDPVIPKGKENKPKKVKEVKPKKVKEVKEKKKKSPKNVGDAGSTEALPQKKQKSSDDGGRKWKIGLPKKTPKPKKTGTTSSTQVLTSDSVPTTPTKSPHQPRGKKMSLQQEEQIAMDTFQHRIYKSRATSQYGPAMAPGFDYINWRPYGYPRYPSNNPDAYLQQIHALVPYVHCVVVSGCQGAEEKRWKSLTQSADSHNATMEATRSAMGSRVASRDRLLTS